MQLVEMSGIPVWQMRCRLMHAGRLPYERGGMNVVGP